MSRYKNRFIAIIDVGTGSIRLSVLNVSGRILDVRQAENKCYYPEPGYVEQDVADWWRDIAEMFNKIPNPIREKIGVIGVTGQREGIVPVNEKYEPLSKLITWLDTRTNEQYDRIRDEFSDAEIYQETGLVHNPAWSLSKILWIRENQPQIYQSCHKLLQAVDYLQSRMAQKPCSDVSMASRTCMLQVTDRRWSDMILDKFEIEIDKLPRLYEPGQEIGLIASKAAIQFGLKDDVMIVAGAGDQQAAAVGVGAFEEGIVSIGIGTSSALSLTISKPEHIKEGNIILNCAAIQDKWEYEPPIWNTGSLIKWYSEQIDQATHSYDELMEEVGAISPGANGVLALPYFSGAGSPRWNPEMSGGFYGLSLNHKRIHLLRAIIESIAYEIRYNIDFIENSGMPVKQIILSGGGSRNTVLCQIICDVLNKPVKVFTEAEASTWGLYCVVLNQLEPGISLQKIHNSLNLDFKQLNADPGKKKIYDTLFRRYIAVGDHLSKIQFI